jgi:DNA-binding PadR family transcriptional regulator
MYSHAMRCQPGQGCGTTWQGAFDPRVLWALMGAQRGGGRRGPGAPRYRGRGFGPPFGPGGQHFRGRARRGDVRAALLVLLEEEPRNGYGLMQEIERRSEGAWRPSPGSVYPALQQLEDEGLVRARDMGGRRLFELTDAGREHVERHREELAEPWAAVAGDVDAGLSELRSGIGQVGAAVMQIAYAGSASQVAEARRVLAETRRALYRLLAEEPEADGEEPPEDAGDEPAGEG